MLNRLETLFIIVQTAFITFPKETKYDYLQNSHHDAGADSGIKRGGGGGGTPTLFSDRRAASLESRASPKKADERGGGGGSGNRRNNSYIQYLISKRISRKCLNDSAIHNARVRNGLG